jgi:hypothetical protein
LSPRLEDAPHALAAKLSTVISKPTISTRMGSIETVGVAHHAVSTAEMSSVANVVGHRAALAAAHVAEAEVANSSPNSLRRRQAVQRSIA